MSRISWAVAIVCAVAIAGVGCFWWWTQLPAPLAEAPAPPPVESRAPAAQPAAPAVAYPLDGVPASAPASGFDLSSELAGLLESKAALALFRLDDFPHRLAATVDNLGRAHAAERLWPVEGAPGRLAVRDGDGVTVIDETNGARYERYVQLLEQVDPKRMATLYVHIYPALQSAYEELGYPHRYFNDRVIEVIDQLLATPEPQAPLAVRAPRAARPERVAQPWKAYAFDDPALEGLSAGQKIVLRTGPGNERRIKAQLREWRRVLAAGAKPAR